jgi:hypothetical protein
LKKEQKETRVSTRATFPLDEILVERESWETQKKPKLQSLSGQRDEKQCEKNCIHRKGISVIQLP